MSDSENIDPLYDHEFLLMTIRNALMLLMKKKSIDCLNPLDHTEGLDAAEFYDRLSSR